MPAANILYMGPGGHRQWPMSINALIDRFSLLIHKTRASAIVHIAAAMQDRKEWCPRYYRKFESHLKTLVENIRGSPSIGSAEATVGRTRHRHPDCCWKEEWPISLAKKVVVRPWLELFKVSKPRGTAEISPAPRADAHA